jgi:TPR repeat protein
VAKDDTEALRWYRKGADDDDLQSQMRLAEYYAPKLGDPQSQAEAQKWYGKAAAQGSVDAQLALGLRYETGPGEVDPVQSYKWLALAAHGFSDAQPEQKRLAQDHLKSVSRKMTPAQIAEAEKLASVWRPGNP